MKRDLDQLASGNFDLLVIGAGIHGATIAWDAALRGLYVALVDRGDFGNATSANSLKTVHGGLRYLQDADLRLVRTMVRERRALLRIAPHLVHPLPCVMPTYHQFKQSKAVMSAALLLNDLLAIDRNWKVDPYNHLPRSRIISREECLQYLPGIEDEGITGGAIWYDGQIYNTERLTLSFVFSAADSGACVANYVEAIDLILAENRVAGIRARDVLNDLEFDVRAAVVVNAAGPWVDLLLDRSGIPNRERKFNLSMAMNFVTRKFVSECAAGVPTRLTNGSSKRNLSKKSRLLFITPWREYSIVGTYHTKYSGHPEECILKEEDIEHFVEEINSAYPEARLKREDILFMHVGFLPEEESASAKEVKLIRRGKICDHQEKDGILGLITVVGVKYTSARSMAQKTVDVVFRKLGKDVPDCRTDVAALHDGHIQDFSRFLSEGQKVATGGLHNDVIRHLIYNYGSQYPRLLNLIKEDPCWGHTLDQTTYVLKAEILYAVRYEMAKKLTDVVLRRTELGSAEMPGEASLQVCADIMGAELGWDNNRKNQEISEVRSVYAMVA